MVRFGRRRIGAGQIGDSGVLSNACDHIEQIPGDAVLHVSVEVVNLGEALMYWVRGAKGWSCPATPGLLGVCAPV